MQVANVDPIADLDGTGPNSPVQTERARHHVRVVGAEQPDVLRAGAPQILGLTAPGELSIDLPGALVRPRHPRLKVPEARSNRRGERLGVGLPDASQHTNRNPDLLGQRFTHGMSKHLAQDH